LSRKVASRRDIGVNEERGIAVREPPLVSKWNAHRPSLPLL